MDNTYRYDVMDNITSLVNAGKPQTLQGGKTIGGAITHTYSYDEWDRLIGAKGTFNGGGSKSATYNLRMEYDKLYNITSKQLNLTQNDLQFVGSLKTGYELTYNYKEDDPFKLESIDTKQYSKDGNGEADTIKRVNSYTFDDNGNLTLQLTDTERDSSHVADTMGTKVKNHLWDEENRLLAINDNGFVSNYFYDANGERTVKLSKPDLFVYVNSSEKLKGDSLTMKFVGYVSPYLVVTNGGRYTKHIYAGTQRIASKLGDIEAFEADPRRVAKAGHDVDNAEPIDFAEKYSKQNTSLSARYDSLKVKTKPKENNDYVNGKSFCCGDNSLDEIEKNEGNGAENAKIEDNLYFYHPDHLGSTNLITNFDGEVTQSVAYIPYGEVFVEERNGSWSTPYLFNAKELDEETGLYYYGARYLDPADCRWLSTDQMQGKYPGMSPYNYCAGNPVKLVDPDGREWNYKMDDNGNVTIIVDINFSVSGSFSEEQVESYKNEISNKFNEVLLNSSEGKVSGVINFHSGNSNIEQSLELGISEDNIGGFTSYLNSFVNLNNGNGELKSSEDVGYDAVHEMLHTLRMDHPFEMTQTNDTELLRVSANSFVSTPSTDKNIIHNIMNYSRISIDGRKSTDLSMLSKGQIDFMMKEIDLQKKGYGFRPKYNKLLSPNQNAQLQFKYYDNYWNETPGKPVKNK